MSECIYAEIITAKNGTPVPVFQNGRTFFSSYNPERDAEHFLNAYAESFSNAGFILIGGIGTGLHILKTAHAYPHARILAFEADEESLAFSKAHLSSELQAIIDNGDRIFLTCAAHLKQALPSHYIPALHGNFVFAAFRSWSDFLGEKAASFIPLINNIISDISADYSVQAQFGKLWHTNILKNLLIFDNMNESQRFDFASFFTGRKKAAIIGAGPSLDEYISILAEKRSEYCIFATDTIYGTLKSAGITPDFVVTVDSQPVSEKHFVGQDLEGTVLAADLTANSSILTYALRKNAPILLFHNQHPLSMLFDSWILETDDTASPFPLIDSGAGTVLHAAADLARKLGFSELVFFGADFAYSKGKPYARGTYLEKQHYTDAGRTGTAETAYCRLMYRSPLITLSEDAVTTDVLLRYKNALSSYLKMECPSILEKYSIRENRSKSDAQTIRLSDFVPWYEEKLKKNDKKVLFSLLPLAAWYKKIFFKCRY